MTRSFGAYAIQTQWCAESLAACTLAPQAQRRIAIDSILTIPVTDWAIIVVLFMVPVLAAVTSAAA